MPPLSDCCGLAGDRRTIRIRLRATAAHVAARPVQRWTAPTVAALTCAPPPGRAHRLWVMNRAAQIIRLLNLIGDMRNYRL